MRINNVEIYTDGACSGNPGPGGWAAILMCADKEREIKGCSPYTTNNQMELTAVVESLRLLKFPCNVTIYSDSAYIVNQVRNGWLDKWAANGWRTADNKPVANLALWDEINRQRKVHKIVFVKVQGHADVMHNIRADKLATEQRDVAVERLLTSE